MVTYEENGKYALYDGIRFCRDENTGYYLNSTLHCRLHRYVYERSCGAIPPGFEIHHIDHDRNNNEPANLKMVSLKEHRAIHAYELSNDERQRRRSNIIESAVPKASEWHRSEAGRKWHKEQYQRCKDALRRKINLVCEYCGKEYSTVNTSNNRFCSGKCKAAWRRKEGIDNEIRICAWCGEAFSINRYEATKCCSRSCANRARGKDKTDFKAT